MRVTTFLALTNYATPAAAIAAVAVGNAFLLNDTQIYRDGTMSGSLRSKRGSRQLKFARGNVSRVAFLRHKVMYFVRDTSATGYHPVYDILEADTAANQTKTSTRPGLSDRSAHRDDDDRIGYKETDWS